MKKKWLIPAIILGSLGIIYFVGAVTGALRTATFPPGSNEPNIKSRSRIWMSNLSKPQRFSFICYNMADNPPEWTGGKWIMRLCGLPGDKVQIIDGILFVNGKDADAAFNLKKGYMLSIEDLKKLGSTYMRDHRDEIQVMENDSVYVTLETDLYRNNSLHGTLVIDTSTADIQKIYDHPWTRDNFGPIIVPEGKFFVLGDNRHGAADSRYTGFIDQANYVGTVLFK